MSELFILGATGYVGSEVVRVALARGHRVRALVRRSEPAARLEQLGVQVTRGDASELPLHIERASHADVLIDLLQPPLPPRLTAANVARMCAQRQRAMDEVLYALSALPAESRPLLVAASGVAELAPDERGMRSHRSSLAETPSGLGRVGTPICRQVQASGVDAVFVHLGLVYGPGKAFASKMVPALARGRMPIVGSGDNRAPLTSLVDAARAIVHVAEQPRHSVRGRHFLATDGQPTTQRELFEQLAQQLGARRPPHIPPWLARVALGSVMVEMLTLDAEVDNSALLATGFHFEHPSLREGIPPMLAALGYAPVSAPGASAPAAFGPAAPPARVTARAQPRAKHLAPRVHS